MAKLATAPGDAGFLGKVKEMADPTLTEEEVVTLEPPRDRKVTKVAPGVFLYDSGMGMSLKLLYYGVK